MQPRGIRIGFFGATGLVLLRIAVGWHFLYSGLWKLDNPNFTSEAFLGQAKGPLAEKFYELIPDVDGTERLDLERQKAGMQELATRFDNHFALSLDQKERVKELLARGQAQMAEFFAENKDDLATYEHELQRLATAKESPTKAIPFQQQRNWDKQTELRGKLAAWSKQLDSVWRDFRGDLANLLSPEQQRLPGLPPADEHPTHKIDRIVTYTNIAIGACLIAGLFTRLAALGGFLFLAQIVAAQPDWPTLYPPPHPSAGRSLIVNKEFIEMTALFALMLLPVGRWAGLDFFIHSLIVRPIYGKREA